MASANICGICNIKSGKYTCPRCNIFYCSTHCYQSAPHNDCSESFFKDCINEMLQSTKKDSKNSDRDVNDILNRVNKDFNEIDEQLLDSDDDDDDEDDDQIELEERLKGINLDDSNLVWGKLTENEKKEYFEFLKSGEMVIEAAWKPFWGDKFESKVIDLEELNELKKRCPKIAKIKDFKSICNKPPADCVRFNLINILASYAFTTRYFDGDHFDEPKEAVSCITQICAVFKSNGKFENYDEAVKSVIYEYKNLSWIETSDENERLLWGDLKDILEGPYNGEKNFYALCCLSDLSRLFKTVINGSFVENGLKGFHQAEGIKFESRDKVKMHVKKVDYYLSYVKDLF